jgi:hypothetical protein
MESAAQQLCGLFTHEQDPKLRHVFWVMSMDMKDHLSMHEDTWNLFWGGGVQCSPNMKQVLFKQCVRIEWFTCVFVKKH